jgi:hypothetical protein
LDFVLAYFCVNRQYESVVTIASEAVLCSVTYEKQTWVSPDRCLKWCSFSVGDLLPAFDFFM